MGNPWLDHVKATMSSSPGMDLKDVLRMAKKTYKKGATKKAKPSRGKKSKKNRKGKTRRVR